MEQTKTQAVTETRQQAPHPFATLNCAMSGHSFRVVLLGKTPTALECSRCKNAWPVGAPKRPEGAPGE